jgi:hypothetical protein
MQTVVIARPTGSVPGRKKNNLCDRAHFLQGAVRDELFNMITLIAAKKVAVEPVPSEFKAPIYIQKLHHYYINVQEYISDSNI